MEEIKNSEVNSQPIPVQTQEEKKPKNTLFIILILVFILLIGGVAAFFLLGEEEDVEVADTETPTEFQEDIVRDIQPEDVTVIEGTQLGLNDELEDDFKLPENFPQDLPLSGGTLIIVSSDSLNHNAQITVRASLSEAQEWYTSALTQNGWDITEVIDYSPMDMLEEEDYMPGEAEREILEMEGFDIVEMTFEKADEGRRGDLTITAVPYSQTVNVSIREILANF